MNTAYNERVDVYSFGLTLLEIIIGNCAYIKRQFPGTMSVMSKANGGRGWRPRIPEAVAESQLDLVQLFRDCVLDDFNSRPSFLDITTRLETCKATSPALEEVDLVMHASTEHGGARMLFTSDTDLSTGAVFGDVSSATKTMEE